MDIRFCQYMAAIAEEMSLSKAAQKLFITQSALSQQLDKMENELGTKLFVYTNNKMVLTESGEIFLKGAKEIIQIKERAYEKIANESKRYTEYISMAVNRQTGSLLVSEFLPIFKKRYPDVKININESDTFSAKQLLLNGSVDLVLMGEAESPHSLIEETFLYNEELVMVIPRSHPLAGLYQPTGGRQVPAANLHLFQNDDFILSQPGSHFRMLVDGILKKNHIVPNVLCELNNFFAVRNMVHNGFGTAFLPVTIAKEYDDVVTVHLNPRAYYRIVIAHHKAMTLSEPMEYLIDVMVKHCKKNYPSFQQ